AVLGVWAVTAYTTYWIDDDSATTRAVFGRTLSKAGKFGGALGQYQWALRKDPGHVAARSWLINLLLSQEQSGPAQKFAEEAMQLHPNEVICRLDLAKVQEQQGRILESVTETSRAVELAPDHPQARLRLASRLFKLGRMSETVAACREGLRLSPTDPDLH